MQEWYYMHMRKYTYFGMYVESYVLFRKDHFMFQNQFSTHSKHVQRDVHTA